MREEAKRKRRLLELHRIAEMTSCSLILLMKVPEMANYLWSLRSNPESEGGSGNASRRTTKKSEVMTQNQTGR